MFDFEMQSAIVAFGTNLFLALYVLLKQRGWIALLNRGFAFLSLTFALWNAGLVFGSPRLFFLGVFLVGPAVYMFLMQLLRRHSPRERRFSGVIWLISLFLIGDFFYFGQPVLLFQILAFFFLTPIGIWGVYHLYIKIQNAGSRREKLQLWYVMVGMIVAGLGGIASFAVLFDASLRSVGSMGGVAYTALITIAIMKHRLLDFGSMAGRIIVIFVLTFIFWLSMGILGNFYVETPYVSLMAILTATLLLVVLYEPLKSIIEGQAGRVLSRDSSLFHQQLQECSNRLVSITREVDLIRELAHTMRLTPRIASFSIHLLDPASGRLVMHASDGLKTILPAATPIQEPLEEALVLQRRPVNQFELVRALRGGLSLQQRRHSAALYRSLVRLHADACFPFIFADEFLGFLCIGFRDEDEELTRIEEETLTAVTRQFAAALAHSRLVEIEKTKDRMVALGQLASGLAHEIRNPIATIKATVEFLDPAASTPENREFFMIIHEEVKRLNRFVERFLEYARPRPRYSLDHLETLGDIIQRVKLMFTTRGMLERIRIDERIHHQASRVRLPADTWIQILTNLIDNAIHALGDAGTIMISGQMHESSATLVLRIEDSGPGIPESDFDRVFEPFYTTRDSGTGLGLAIVHQLIQGCKGTITISRSSLGGALFIIQQPIDESGNVRDPASETRASPSTE